MDSQGQITPGCCRFVMSYIWQHQKSWCLCVHEAKVKPGGLQSSAGFQVVWQADPRLRVDRSTSTVQLHKLTTEVDQRTSPFRLALESRIQEKPAQEKGNHYCCFQEQSQSGAVKSLWVCVDEVFNLSLPVLALH